MTKKFDLQAFKKSLQAASVPYKKENYIQWDDALKEVSGLPGLPLGHITQIYGPSNGGKTTLALTLAAKALQQNVLPIFIITEGKFMPERAATMGVDVDAVLSVDVTYIEEIFDEIHKFLSAQSKGDIPKDILFIVDSIGNTISRDSVRIAKDGNTEVGGAMMKTSKVIREQMRVVSHRINDTRKVNSPHFAGLVFINHSYKQPPAFPGGPTTDVPYGGDGIYYSSSLVIKVRKTRQLKAVKDGRDVSFGIAAKLAVEKNHINGVSNEGPFLITSNAIIPDDPAALKQYKEDNKDSWGNVKIDVEE
jgi:recombination protein RecA